MTHVAEANDYRLATEGAVEVASSDVFYRLWLADIRGLQAALKDDAAALKEIVEWCRQQEVSDD